MSFKVRQNPRVVKIHFRNNASNVGPFTVIFQSWSTIDTVTAPMVEYPNSCSKSKSLHARLTVLDVT